MRLLRQIDELSAFRASALVPTMGALHEGHASLIRQAARSGAPALVTIFVNPTQFAPHEDLAKYPRTLEADLALAERAGADAVYVPTPEAIYPQGEPAARAEATAWPLPSAAMEPQLEDHWRPGHFGGVCQVVARLLDLTQPFLLILGEKDFQQLRVLTEMVQQEPRRWPSLKVHPGPTVREPDGLAMSSRNRYLLPAQRDEALGLFRALQMAASAQHPATAETLMLQTLQAHGLAVDYAVVRDSQSLRTVHGFERPTRALIAARLGTVRLIDNLALPVCR